MKKKITLLSTLLLGGSLMQVSAQDHIYDWGYGIGGASNEVGVKISTDNNGNVIHVGNFGGTFDADPGSGTTNLTSSGSNDISISKFDTGGNLIWAKSIGGPLLETVAGLDIASDGSIYVSGGFQGTVDFDPSTGVQNVTSNGGSDLFLLKLDSNGDFQWVYTAGSTQEDFANDAVVDNNDNVYLTGSFRNTVDFDAGLGTSNLTSHGGKDGYVVKLDPTGAFISNHHLGGTSDIQPYGIIVDISNDIYVVGEYMGTVNLDVANGPQNYTSAGDLDAFLMKLNQGSTFSWAHSLGSATRDQGADLTIDLDNNVIYGGAFSGTVDFDPDPVDTDIKTAVAGLDIALVKFDSNGDYIFSAVAGGNNDDAITGISVDGNNNIYASGFFRYTADFDPGVGVANVSVNCSCVYADQFIWNLDEDGNYLFAESVGGTSNDHALDVHADGSFLYNTGYFNGSTDLDLSTSVAPISTAGGNDMSISKHFICNPIATTDVITSCDPITWIDGNTYNADNNTATMMLTNQYGCDSLVTLDFRLTTIDDQTVTASDVEFCDNGTPTFDLGSSENGVFYSLVDQSNGTVLDGPTEGTGSALTLSGGNITATTTFEVQAETNKNNALTFTGNSATPTHVNMGNEINDVFRNKDQITVEGWINTNSPSNLQTITGNYGQLGNTMQFLLRLDNQKATFWVGTGTNPADYQAVVGTTTITQGTWYHIAGTYDGTTLSVYVNGVLENTVALSANMPDVDNNFTIGGGLTSNTEYFSGDITGIRIWNVARTETQINTDKDQCLAGNTPGIVAMYNMIDGSGSAVLTDESVNGYDGTLTNMDNNTSWNYTNLPSIACQVCSETMTQTPTVTVNNSTTGTDVQSECETFTWIDGNTYTSSNNTATHVLTNAAGCDSIVTLDLTILEPTTGTDVQSECETFTWIDGNTYTSSNNTATHVLTNAAGCDSIVTLDLTILEPTTGTDVQVACGSFTWIDGNTYTADNNTATQTLTNAAGCDSIVTLDLTINNTLTGTDVQTACDTYTWIDGNTYTTDNNTATQTLTSVNGCDSIVTLDLTINASPVAGATDNGDGTITASGTGSYQWIDCNTNMAIAGETSSVFAPTQNGDYQVAVSNGDCADTSDCVTIDYLGLSELDNSELSAYPNPTTGKVTISSTNNLIRSIIIIDATGRRVNGLDVNASSITVDLSNVETGVYFIEVESVNQSRTRLKIVKR